jgi:eukaryotic-like serine/threonine-protein kinase
MTVPAVPTEDLGLGPVEVGQVKRERMAGSDRDSGSGIGAVVGKYKILNKVGHGGMSVVYRAIDQDLGREVAVKVLHDHLADSQEARDRFAREARAVAKLKHPNILEIYDYAGSDNNAATHNYIVTEFIEGQTLKQFVTAQPLTFPEIAALICLQISRALQHAHSASVLHRDIKPENVMIRSDGAVKLMDFGISHMVDLERLTVTGQLLGSPAYMAPEHVEGKPIDYRTDVFALGTVLYQLCTGNLPFSGKNAHEVLRKIVEGKFPDPRHANPAVSNPLARIILRAMAAAPNDRYQTVTEMTDALAKFSDDSGLGDANGELAVYFAGPAKYEAGFADRLADTMASRGAKLMATAPSLALDAFDRALVCNPKHEKVLAYLANMRRKQTTKRVALAAAGLVAAGGICWAAVQLLGSSDDHSPTTVVAIPDSELIAVEKIGPTTIGTDNKTPAAPTSTTSLPVAIATAPVAVEKPNRPQRNDEPKPLPVSPITAPIPNTLAPATLTFSPTSSEFKIDNGEWQTNDTGRVQISLNNGPVRVAVRNDKCCEAKNRVIGETDAGQTVSMSLAFLPAQITPVCATATSVRIDGKAARLGAPSIVPFGETTKTQRQIKIEFVGDEIVTKTTVIRPADNAEVSCEGQ